MNQRFQVMLALVALLPAGCAWIGLRDRSDDYLDAKSIEPVRIPDSLDRPDFRDAMGVPQVVDSRGLEGKKFSPGLPEALSTTFGVDKIVIKKLGDTRWVFLDAPPASVWPKVKQFWETNNLPIEKADPRRGILETQWLTSREGTPEEVFEDLKKGVSWADSGATVQNKFRLRIEPGVRSGSSEIYLEQKQIPLGGPYRKDSVKWGGGSDNPGLEEKVLTSLAYYLGDTINQSQSVSKLAGDIRENRAVLVPDATQPVLKYKLPFNRAWATVGSALDNARIEVADLDRTSAIYYVNYRQGDADRPGFFGRLFSSDESGAGGRYIVHVQESQGDEVHVTVENNDRSPADPLVAESLLKIIKEYST